MARKPIQKPIRKTGSVCVLASGGADSSILLHELAGQYETVIPVYIRNELVWEEAEQYWLGRFIEAVDHPAIGPLEVLDLPMGDVYRAHWSMTGEAVPDHVSGWEKVYLPGRNLILLSKTAVYCAIKGINVIALGPLKTNPFADSSPDFFSGYQRLIERALGRRFEIITPLSTLRKEEVLRLGRRLPLEKTFSCLNPQGMDHCGACNKCAERISAFSEAGIEDRTVYRRQKIVSV